VLYSSQTIITYLSLAYSPRVPLHAATDAILTRGAVQTLHRFADVHVAEVAKETGPTDTVSLLAGTVVFARNLEALVSRALVTCERWWTKTRWASVVNVTSAAIVTGRHTGVTDAERAVSANEPRSTSALVAGHLVDARAAVFAG